LKNPRIGEKTPPHLAKLDGGVYRNKKIIISLYREKSLFTVFRSRPPIVRRSRTAEGTLTKSKCIISSIKKIVFRNDIVCVYILYYVHEAVSKPPENRFTRPRQSRCYIIAMVYRRCTVSVPVVPIRGFPIGGAPSSKSSTHMYNNSTHPHRYYWWCCRYYYYYRRRRRANNEFGIFLRCGRIHNVVP